MLIQIEPPFQRVLNENTPPPVFILSSKQMLFNTSSENTLRGLLITVRSLTSQSSHMRLFPSIPLVYFLCFLTPVKMVLLPVVVVSASGTGFKTGWNLSTDTRHHRTEECLASVTAAGSQHVFPVVNFTSLRHKHIYWHISEWMVVLWPFDYKQKVNTEFKNTSFTINPIVFNIDSN